MIGWIEGSIKSCDEHSILLVTQGVGYQVFISKRHLSEDVYQVGNSLGLYIYTHVREDQLLLFGFPSLLEKSLFIQLLSVSGVGAKTALSVLSELSADQVLSAILNKDTSTIQKCSGIGKKTAERMVLELYDKIKKLNIGSSSLSYPRTGPKTPEHEVLSALINLGYKSDMAEQALVHSKSLGHHHFEDMLKSALKVLGG